MNDWQRLRAKEFSDFYGWPLHQVEELFSVSKSFFECVWLGMNPVERWQEELYYNGPWLTLRQMSYDENDALPTSLKHFIDESSGLVLDFGCGAGDTLIYGAQKDKAMMGIETLGKIPFLKYRRDIRGLDYDLISGGPLPLKAERVILSSVLDHLPDPVSFAHQIVKISAGPIYATPCIDESYDRPTHNKEILRHVPEAFKIIRKHNEPYLGTATFP